MCSKVCENYGGYLKQDFKALKCCCKGGGTVPATSITTKTKPTSPPTSPTPTISLSKSCAFSPMIFCSPGTTRVNYNGFCGCLKTKRCQSETSSLYDTPNDYLSWIEEFNYNTDSWQMIETCLLPNPICNPNTFRCVTIGPTGPKEFGKGCEKGSECQSGECDTRYTSSSGEDIISPLKTCTPSLKDQGTYAKKRHDTDAKGALIMAAGLHAPLALYFAVASSPLLADTFLIANTSGMAAGSNFLLQQLQQPAIQNKLATLNIATTLYATSDCVKNGPNGEWCNMLVALASNNPGEFGSALATDATTLKKAFSGSTLDLALGKIFSQAKNLFINKSSTERIVTAVTELPGLPQKLIYQPLKLPQQAKGPWPIGQTFPSNRGGNVVISENLNSGTFGIIYKAKLYEPNQSVKSVVAKFSVEITPAEVVILTSEQYLLAKANNVLPPELRLNFSKPYGFITVETEIGKVQFPVIENFGPGNSLSTLINNNRRINLSRTQVDKIYKVAGILDNQKIYMRDIMSNNVFITNEGRIILFDPYIPRLNNAGQLLEFTRRKFLPERVQLLRLDIDLLQYDLAENVYYFNVPTGNVAALDKMFQLYRNVITIK